MHMRFVRLKIKEEKVWDARKFYEERVFPQLEQTDGNRRPTRLVRQEAVVKQEVECQSYRDHECGQLDRPPVPHDRGDQGGQCKWDERRREPRLEPASQRVGHRFTARRNRRAAYFAPMSVSCLLYTSPSPRDRS